jgi:hypothetical protein
MTAMATSWTLSPGETTRRVDLHATYGGGGQGGIAPSARTPNVLIFSDPASGEHHGYFDGWHDDGFFHYTGEGQRGDQQMRAGNAAIVNHVEDGRALRVFDGARGLVTYVDEFELADDEPYYRTDAPETDDGPTRQVIVFRLRPLTIAAAPSSPIDPLLKTQVETVPVEQQLTEKTWVAPNAEGHEAERREQKLVLTYRDHLLRRGVDATRLKLVPDGEHKPLFTDLYSADLNLLVEAKGTGERGSIRMALGQLADYRRFISPTPMCAILLPQPPRPDLAALLKAENVVAIWQDGARFEDSVGGTFV